MKKITLLFSALLMVSFSALAQIKMYLYFNDGTRVEYIASRVDSIKFDSPIDEPDDSDKPGEEEKPDGPVGPKPDPNTPNANGHEYVDLGLPSGLLWATCNVGADSPEDYGYYFAWGETQPKENYNWSTYKYSTDYDQLTKYCNYGSYGKDGFTDNKTVLDPEDDAATANWGGAWRMPTRAEQQELINNCTWTWTTQNGVNGYKVTGPNGNSIFLPAADCMSNSSLNNAGLYGSFWSSSLNTDTPDLAFSVHFSSGFVVWHYYSRSDGQSVRPVCK